MTRRINQEVKPLVKFTFSELATVPLNQEFSFHDADMFLHALTTAYKIEAGYNKTGFEISFELDGQKETYEGRFDIGSSREWLFDHIKGSHEWHKKNNGWNFMNDPEKQKEIDSRIAFMENEFIPYLKKYKYVNNYPHEDY